MACLVVSVVTMGLKICQLLPIWKKYMEFPVDLTYGGGKWIFFLEQFSDVYNTSFRSVHNIQIERLWFDVTSGFGRKWKVFFQELEMWDGLDVENSSHIWLLHHLFLSAINKDTQDWLGAWNNHVVSMQGEWQRSPRDTYFFGMLEEGPQGVKLAEEDFAGYGVDWEELNDVWIRAHHDEANAIELVDDSEAR